MGPLPTVLLCSPNSELKLKLRQRLNFWEASVMPSRMPGTGQRVQEKVPTNGPSRLHTMLVTLSRMGNWMADEDNWENLGRAIASPVYTPAYNVGGGPSHEEMCLTYEPQPGELIPDNPEEGYYNDYDETYTVDFNYQLENSGIPSKMIYGLFGDTTAPDYRMMRTRDCEAVDCLNPCYEDGSCFKCADAALESAKETGDGVRIPVCDLCSVPAPTRGRGRR